MFEDDSGRTIIFHGVNVVVKAPPYIPITSSFDPQMSLCAQDIQNLQNWGFNFVRLGVMWQAVETSPGSYNMTYLQQVNNLVNQLGAAGISVLLDAHQDLFARKICGEGVPDFYAQNLTDSCGELSPVYEGFGACIPLSKFNLTYDANGDPLISDCLTHDFPRYYMTPEAADAFQRLYKNINGLQDKFLAFWNTVSSFFANNPFIVGYDPFNEPLAADMYTNPDYMVPGNFDREVLQYLWQKVNVTVRKNDLKKILFFEPVQSDVLPTLGGLIFNVGFNETPGGVNFNNAQVLNDHTYCCAVNFNPCVQNGGDPPLSEAKHCERIHNDRVKVRSQDAEKLGVGLIFTEFGACSDSDACVAEITSVTNACDKYLVGWSYWQFKGYGDYTTAGSTVEGFYDGSGNLETNKLKALQRTYAQAYQGVPTKLFFIPSTGYFSTSYDLSPNVNAPTVIFLNQAIVYPNGYDISISNTLNLQPVVTTKGNFINILYTNPVSSRTTIVITAKSAVEA
eukprot:CAMPEP_0202946080 /NCGR_PEP_ID=MMETSP1395-20130829/8365_1 /ASSEMBLY_ACC=CAM_ASM_000871 /TAXON_ID=5961 /ORGANISM="Blepharisma japonicum, Strain Stock R1072" /LENGTH=508 /DNA_ID=CAMNT_0049646453 /DNA_START=69 /DNA_END=1595 /DNA_ORIENTATION=+